MLVQPVYSMYVPVEPSGQSFLVMGRALTMPSVKSSEYKNWFQICQGDVMSPFEGQGPRSNSCQGQVRNMNDCLNKFGVTRNDGGYKEAQRKKQDSQFVCLYDHTITAIFRFIQVYPGV